MNTILLPRLEAGLRVLPFSASIRRILARWDTSIFRATLAGTPELANDRWKRIGSSRDAICLILDLRLPSAMHWITRVTEAGVRLNGVLAMPTDSGHLGARPLRTCRTAWLRLAALARVPLTSSAHASPQSAKVLQIVAEKGPFFVDHRNNRWASLLRVMAQNRIEMLFNRDSWHAAHTQVHTAEPGPSAVLSGDPYARRCLPPSAGPLPEDVHTLFVCDAPRLGRIAPCAPAQCSLSEPVLWYSDGATTTGGDFPFSGFAAVCSDLRTGADTNPICVIGAVRGKGNNHTAECTGISVPLKVTAVNLDVLIGTDSLANIWCLQGARHPDPSRGLQLRAMTARRRNRIAPRPLVMSYQKQSRFRWVHHGSVSRLFWVRAHTGRLDRHSIGNARADSATHVAVARARRLGKNYLQDVCIDDETVIFRNSPRCWDSDGRAYLPAPRYINGDIRKALLRHHRSDLLHAWCLRAGNTGDLARQYANIMVSHCSAVRKARQQQGLLSTILLLTQSLVLPQPPVRWRYGSAAETDVLTCPLCHVARRGDARHALECDAMRDVVREAVLAANACLEPARDRPHSSLPARDLPSMLRDWAHAVPRVRLYRESRSHATLMAEEFARALHTSRPSLGVAPTLPLTDAQLRPALTRTLATVHELNEARIPGLPDVMKRLLSKHLSLSTDAFATEATRSELFCYRHVPSGSPCVMTGASALPIMDVPWDHKSMWAHPPLTSHDTLYVQLFRRARESLLSVAPVRLVLVMPERASTLPLCATALRADAGDGRHEVCLARFSSPGVATYRLTLMANDASFLADPVDWPLLAAALCSAAAELNLPLLPGSVLGSGFEPAALPPPGCGPSMYTENHGFIDVPSEGLWHGRVMPSAVTGCTPRGIFAAMHWYDPTVSTFGVPLSPIGPLTRPDMYDAYTEQHAFDRLAGFVGMLPSRAKLLIRWRTDAGEWCAQKQVDALCKRLLACLLSSSTKLLHTYLARVSAWLMHATTRDAVLTMAQSAMDRPRPPRRGGRGAATGRGRRALRSPPIGLKPPSGVQRRIRRRADPGGGTIARSGPAAGTRAFTSGRAAVISSYFYRDSNTTSGRTAFEWYPTDNAVALWTDFGRRRWRHICAVARQLCLRLPSDPGVHYWVDGW